MRAISRREDRCLFLCKCCYSLNVYYVWRIRDRIKLPSLNDVLVPMHRPFRSPRAIRIREIDIHQAEVLSGRRKLRLNRFARSYHRTRDGDFNGDVRAMFERSSDNNSLVTSTPFKII